MQIQPIASATPDGHVRINILLSRKALLEAEIAEAVHWDGLIERISEDGIYRVDSRPQTAPKGIGLRKDAFLRFGSDYRRISYSIGDAVGEECSRSHELKKSRTRRARRR